MLLNRSHVSWAWFTALATLALVALYLMTFHPGALPFHVNLPMWLAPHYRQHYSVGNTPLGLAYGGIAYAIFIFAVLLNVRKRFPLMRVGRAQTWLRAHIWLTILTLPLVFLHAAFRFGGAMTSTLMWLYLLVMFSGFYGLALQQFMPRLIKSRLTLETIFEQIPYLTQQLLAAALKMREELRPAPAAAGAAPAGKAAAAAGDAEGAVAVAVRPTVGGSPSTAAVAPSADDPSVNALIEALDRTVLPYLASRKVSHYEMDNVQFSTEFFRLLRLRVGAVYQERADQLASWCEERRQMELQTRYHHWLHGWLLVHVPASLLLIILTGWHAVVLLFLY